MKYDHDYVNKAALKRILDWQYADGEGRTAGSRFREDLGTAFHWPATPQGADHWMSVGDTNPKTETLPSSDREYLSWLLTDSRAADAI
ncbi:hypothetical protein CN151_10600 [Sinorhizobium meliloti]|uniref:hypothetical protein n=1 Tax=Rhizobium meliloti TaxID=382 RepID=UPI000FD50AAD|nr:hypothetical protein [Sinorhizobium meliloti]RVL05087.1 hypothetical protein CN151_10600 [Sinorhizobium meliloti]